jgi:hypothetical protein
MRGRHRLSIASVACLACCLFAPSFAVAAAPTIERQWVSGVTSTDATLNAEIDSSGLPTRYELQIDTTGNFRFFQTSSCPLDRVPMFCLTAIEPGDPLPEGLVQPPEFDLPASGKAEHVSVNMASIGATLQPGTVYHYRAIAANGEVLAAGPDQTFTTPLEPPPVEPVEQQSGLGLLPAQSGLGLLPAPESEAATGPTAAKAGRPGCLGHKQRRSTRRKRRPRLVGRRCARPKPSFSPLR